MRTEETIGKCTRMERCLFHSLYLREEQFIDYLKKRFSDGGIFGSRNCLDEKGMDM